MEVDLAIRCIDELNLQPKPTVSRRHRPVSAHTLLAVDQFFQYTPEIFRLARSISLAMPLARRMRSA